MKPTENRKSNKPIMEKRRRARINQCLNELKSLILEALRKDPARHSKLEKADILEMTVKYLQNLQRQQMALKLASDPHVMSKYRAGFGECVAEVARYLSTFDNIDTAVRERLITHLAQNLKGLPTPMSTMSTLAASSDLSKFYRNLQLIPTRLPGGEVLFLVPSTSPLMSTFSTPALPGTPTDEPLSVEVRGGSEGDEKSSPTCEVVQDLSTKLSMSSSGSESPESGDVGDDDDEDDDDDEGNDDGAGAGSEPWRPW